MPLFGKKDSGKKVRKDGHKDIDKQIINIEDKYHLRQVLGKWVQLVITKFPFASKSFPHLPRTIPILVNMVYPLISSLSLVTR